VKLTFTPELVLDLCTLARHAGDAILTVRQACLAQQHELKLDGSPVTQADLAAHQVIVQGLAALTPKIPVVSEEGVVLDQPRYSTFWLVDPLDGTREFVAGSGEFTVNIALIEHETPVFGVVYVPMTAELFWGGSKIGAWVERDAVREPLQVALPVRPNLTRPLRVLASKRHLNAETQAFLAKLGPIDLVNAGSSLKFCRIAQAQADLYPRLGPTCEWDTAAAQAVLEGAGGYVFDLKGMPLKYGKPDPLNPFFIASSQPFSELESLLRVQGFTV
jgi:3'(2'), 5'-bisphosphate nucleotidase